MSTNINKVDIAVCTWNRPRLLKQTLDSFSRLVIPESISLRILVVDNNSANPTANVIKKFLASDFAKAHTVVPLFETQQGHTYSRNCAIDSADSDLMIWTDDDVIVWPGWVSSYVEAANANPKVTFFGGSIEPEFVSRPPDWITDNWEILKGCFAEKKFDASSHELDESRLPFGANFAIRTSVQKEFQFNRELGRRGDKVLGEDELDLFRRLLAQGHRGQWVRGVALKHVIPEDRASEKYVYDYFVGQGQALVSKGMAWHADVDKLKAEAKSEHRSYKLKRFFSASNVWVSHMVRSALAQGQADAL